MSKLNALVKRNIKEILREPLALVFCILFPLVMLVFMSAILGGLEFTPENFQIQNYAPGICVFGYTFTMMFVSMIIAGDKNVSFINRLKVAPVKQSTYLLSCFIAALPIILIQTVLFFLVALCFGFPFGLESLISMIYLLPSACLYVSLGVLIGVLCSNEKQTGPICSIFVSLVGILGGIFMPLSMLKGAFKVIVDILPFGHSVSIASEIFSVGYSCIYPHILIILGYTVVVWLLTLYISKLKNK